MANYFGRPGVSDEWYTPKYIFDAMGCRFDLDVAAPEDFSRCHVPAGEWLWRESLATPWFGFVWMNAPFGPRNGLIPWLHKFFGHGNGIALVPDRTSAPWFQSALRQSSAALFLAGKVKFERPDGSVGASPGDGTVLLAGGEGAREVLRASRVLGTVVQPCP